MRFLLSFLFLTISLLPAFGQGQGKQPRYFENVEGLLASNPNDANRAVWLLGLHTVSDNQGGLWYWFPTSTTATNLTQVFQANSTTVGRWEKINLPGTAVVDTSGFITNFTVITVRDIPSLKNVAVDRGIQAVIVRGYFNPNDKGEGIFVYDSTSAEPEDGGRVVAPNNGAGKWIRVVTPETIFATWFNPTVTNGTLRISVDYAASAVKGTVILPGVDIYLDGTDPIYIPSHVTIMGQTGTRIIVADNPATNYVPFILSGVEASGLQNMVIVGWPTAPGDAANTGYGVAMTNVTNCVMGGIVYHDFYSEPVHYGDGVAGNGNKFYDEDWTLNSVKGYGAVPNDGKNDTVAFAMAVANATPKSGSSVAVPPGNYALKLWITNASGLVIEALNQGGQGLTNYTLTPFDPAWPVITIGTNTNPSGYPNRSITLRGLMFDYRGPSYVQGTFSTYGKYGLSIRGGTESVYIDNCEWQGFSSNGVEIIGGTVNGAGVENITFNNPNIQLSVDSVTNGTHGLYTQYSAVEGGPSDLTFVTLINGKFNGAANGAIIKDAGVHLKFFGGYIDGYAPNMIVLTNWTANNYPQVEWFGTTWDNHNGGYTPGKSFAVISNEFTGSFPWNGAGGFHEGTAEINWNGKQYPAYNWMLPATNGLYNPLVIGTVRFTVPGDYYESADNYFANDSSTNLIANSGHSLLWTHAPGGTFQVGATTNAALTVRELITSYDVMTVTITNLPTDGVSTFVIGTTNNFPTNRVWVSVVTDPTYQVLIGADTNVCATNFYNQIIAFPYTNLLSGISLSSNIVTLTSGIGSGLTNASTTGWSTITNEHRNLYGISTWLQHAGVSRIIPGGEFRIDDPAADRILSITTNAVADSIRFTSTGVGINQTAPAFPLTIRGNQSAVNGTEVSIAVTDTNLSGSRAALVIQHQANPSVAANTNTTTWEALSIEAGTATSASNAATVEGLRIAINHRSPNTLTNATLLHIGVVTTNGAVITENGLLIENMATGTTNYAIKTGSGKVQLGATLSYATEGGTAISPVGKDANGLLTTNGLGFVGSATATAVAGRDAGNNLTTASTTGLVPTFAGLTANGTISANTGTLTLDGAAANFVTRYNNIATVFTGGVKGNLTDTAHAAGSRWISWSVNASPVWELSPEGSEYITKTMTPGGTVGAQTINKASGRVNFAAGASTLVVTDSLVDTNSVVTIQVNGTDATATTARVTKGAGSFTITMNAAATAETEVDFRITN